MMKNLKIKTLTLALLLSSSYTFAQEEAYNITDVNSISLEGVQETQDFIYPPQYIAAGLVAIGTTSASSASISKTGPLGRKTRNFTFKYIVIPGTILALGTSYIAGNIQKKELAKLTGIADEYDKLLRLVNASLKTGVVPMSAKLQATLAEYECKHCKTDEEKLRSFSENVQEVDFIVEEFIRDKRVSIDINGVHNLEEVTSSPYIITRVNNILGENAKISNTVTMINILRIGLFSRLLEEI